MSRLAVVTPSFGYRRFIEDALDSVQGQTVPTRHLVIDGGSTDGTQDVLAARLPPGAWISEPDDGQSDALNKGFDRVSEPFLGWLNADEYYFPWAAEVVLDAFDSTGADVVFGSYARVDEAGRLISVHGNHPMRPFVLRHGGCFLASCATFYRSDMVRGLGLRRELRLAMDWDLYLRLARAGARFAFVPSTLASYRLHENQVSIQPSVLNTGERSQILEDDGTHPTRPSRLLARGLRWSQLVLTGNGIAAWRATRALQGHDTRWFDGGDADPAVLQLRSLR